MLASHPSAKPLRRPPSARLSPPEPRPRGTPQGSVASACSTFFPAPHLAAPAARLRRQTIAKIRSLFYVHSIRQSSRGDAASEDGMRQTQFSRGARTRRSERPREVVEGGTLAVQRIDRLGFAMRAASEARAEGDVKAMAPFIEALDRHDRCRGLGGVRGNRNAPQAAEKPRNGSRNGKGDGLARHPPRAPPPSSRLPDRRVAALQRLAMTPKPGAAREPQRAASF